MPCCDRIVSAESQIVCLRRPIRGKNNPFAIWGICPFCVVALCVCNIADLASCQVFLIDIIGLIVIPGVSTICGSLSQNRILLSAFELPLGLRVEENRTFSPLG